LLDFVYARVAGARRRWYERHPDARRRLNQPVISVGNLSVGGTGKTPLVGQLAEWLIQQGERPAILSRGYGRADAADGVVVVSDGHALRATVARAGDEPFMLARAVSRAVVCVCEDRYLAGTLAERQLGATVHLLDDGFQHVQLERDLDILVTSPGEIGGGRVLPFGRLREGAAAAARAHFVVVVEADVDMARNEAWELGISQFAAARRILATRVTGETGETGATGAGLPRRSAHPAEPGLPRRSAHPAEPGLPRRSAHRAEAGAIAVAGIAKPEQFFGMLRDAGYVLAGTIAFPDHHRFAAKDLTRIRADLERTGASGVVTTEKDFVRFEAAGPLPFPIVAVPMALAIEGWDRLGASLMAAIARRRSVDLQRSGDAC
jgi:tetraacyldisaccharide 4'-kinase